MGPVYINITLPMSVFVTQITGERNVSYQILV